jgi:phosphoglycolate phosphatase-like HAD superfamily hydrolase
VNAAVFDWDGTLAHIDAREFYCINEALQENGLKPIDLEFYIRNYYRRAYELGTGPRMVLEAAASSQNSTNIEHIYESYRAAFHGTIEKAELQPGAIELLQALKQHGFKLGIATMRFTRRIIQSEIEYLRIGKFVDVLLTREDLGPERTLESIEETVQKRAALVKRALQGLHSTPLNGFLVGDSWWDVRAGKQIGIRTVLVRTGFSKYNDFATEKPDITVASLIDLQNMLEKTNWGFGVEN